MLQFFRQIDVHALENWEEFSNAVPRDSIEFFCKITDVLTENLHCIVNVIFSRFHGKLAFLTYFSRHLKQNSVI